MSKWTHVAGMLRLDSIRMLMPEHRPSLVKEVVEKDIPSGSEGPCEVTVAENGDPNHISAFVASIHGDLRDFGAGGSGDTPEDIEGIEKWMEGVCGRLRAERLGIRQFVLSAEVEFHGTYTWVAVTDGNVTDGVRLVLTFEPYKDAG